MSPTDAAVAASMSHLGSARAAARSVVEKSASRDECDGDGGGLDMVS